MDTNMIGIALSSLVGLGLIASGVMKLIEHTTIKKNLTHLGYKSKAIRPIGLVEVIVVILYLIPQTSFFGSILITGYMGGAIASHVRMSESFLIQTVIPILAWVGYGLRNQDTIRQAIGI